jgi:hypothetical protein
MGDKPSIQLGEQRRRSGRHQADVDDEGGGA